MKSLSPSELAQWLSESADSPRPQPRLLDVREPWEFETCHLPGSQLVPMREFAERVQDLEADRPIVCICHHGARSAQVALFLESRGVPDVFNLSGGLDAWAVQVDPGFPRY